MLEEYNPSVLHRGGLRKARAAISRSQTIKVLYQSVLFTNDSIDATAEVLDARRNTV